MTANWYNRITAALLAALCVCATACSGGGEPVETTAAPAVTTAPAAEVTEPVETEPVDPRTLVKDDLPADLTFEGRTFNIYVGNKDQDRKFTGGPEEATGELLEDAVYKRNMIVEDRLKINIETLSNDDNFNINTVASQLILANDQTYDLFIGKQLSMASLVTQQLMFNAYDLPHINFSQPWWDDAFMEEMSLGKGSRYLLSGDFFLGALDWTRVMLFNKTFYQDQFGNPDDLYRKALDGNWLLEDMSKLVSEAFSDLNNNGDCDPDDRLGFVTYLLLSSTDPFVYGSNVDFTIRDENGYIQLNLADNEKGVKLLEDLTAFFHQNGVESDTDGKSGIIFKEGRALFTDSYLTSLGSMRDMDQDFGLIVTPKSEAEQESYHSLVHDGGFVGAVPISSANHDMIGAVLEVLGVESYRSVYPAYYETTLKVKYVRDDVSSQMVDLVRDTKTTNFIYAYSDSLNKFGHIYRTMISANNNNYASTVKGNQKAAQRKLEQLIEKFEQTN